MHNSDVTPSKYLQKTTVMMTMMMVTIKDDENRSFKTYEHRSGILTAHSLRCKEQGGGKR